MSGAVRTRRRFLGLSRRLWVVIAVLALAMNFLVAWACVVCSKTALPATGTNVDYHRGSASGSAFDVPFPDDVPDDWPDVASQAVRLVAFGYVEEVFTANEPRGAAFVSLVMHVRVEAGWPLRSVRAREVSRTVHRTMPPSRPATHTYFGAGGLARGHSVDTIPVVSWLARQRSERGDFYPPINRRLPLVPRPLAFLGNTVFYLILLGAPLVFVSGVRRGVGTAQGRCATCAYDRSGLAVETPCPECSTVPSGASGRMRA